MKTLGQAGGITTVPPTRRTASKRKTIFAAGTAEMLNGRALEGAISSLIIIAAPRTLGELRKHYHKALSAILVGEIAKDLTGHSVADVQKTIVAAPD